MKSRSPGEYPYCVRIIAASERCCVPWLTTCAMICHNTFVIGAPFVVLYWSVAANSASVTPATNASSPVRTCSQAAASAA